MSDISDAILVALRDGPLRLPAIADKVGIKGTSANHNLKWMVESGCLMHEARGDYWLSEVGQIEAELVASRAVLREHAAFWQGHDLSGIPACLQARIGCLSGAQIVSDGGCTVQRSQDEFIEAVGRAKAIYGVSPIMAPAYPEMIESLVVGGAEVNLVLTREVANQIDPEQIKRLQGCPNFHLHVVESARVAFTVADDCLFMGLYGTDGRYDLNHDLVCKGERAREWGMDLFNYYKSL